MKEISSLFWIAIFASCLMESSRGARREAKKCFSKDFKFGVATASYQVEGAWNSDGKGESIWDHYTHVHPERVYDHSNGDVADDSYHLFREDVQLMKNLGVHYYRFSISWPRILPNGLSNNANEQGVRYYMEVIDELLRNGIAPIVTMYHWDLPQVLQDLGGWTNPIIADYYEDYARVLFSTFGHKVHTWITFNEPLSFCGDGYGGSDAPGAQASGTQDYMCGHHVLRAHARAYRLFHREFRREINGTTIGQVFITLNFAWMEPSTTSEEDKLAAETARQFIFGWFAHPIFSPEGDYPPIMRQIVDDMSKRQNYSRSRLPTFTKEEVEAIRGSSDLLGLNHYTTQLASKGTRRREEVSFSSDMGVKLRQNPNWPKSHSSWLRVVPWGFRKALNWIKSTYNNPITVITENGISTGAGVNDPSRVHYITSYLGALHDAIKKDGCNVVAYTHWSLMDNFEWMRGFSERFGLYEVDYTSANRTRTPRLSAKLYQQIIKTGCLPP